MATFYNPDLVPDFAGWQKLSVEDQMRLVRNYHTAARVKVSKDHAYLHVLVENQLVSGYRPAIRALERLQMGGLGRHNAVHAIADAFAAFYRALRGAISDEERRQVQLSLNAKLEALR
jgi:hypothetical protein